MCTCWKLQPRLQQQKIGQKIRDHFLFYLWWVWCVRWKPFSARSVLFSTGCKDGEQVWNKTYRQKAGSQHFMKTKFPFSFSRFCLISTWKPYQEFITLYENKIPIVFLDSSLRNFQNAMRNFSFSQSVNGHKLETWHKTHMYTQPGGKLPRLGHRPISWVFPDFVWVFWG